MHKDACAVSRLPCAAEPNFGAVDASCDAPKWTSCQSTVDREDDVLDYPFVNAAGGLELFDLQHFETIWVRAAFQCTYDSGYWWGWSCSICSTLRQSG